RAHEDAQAGLDRAGLAPARAAPVRRPRVRGRAHRRRRAEVHGVARRGTGGGGRVSARRDAGAGSAGAGAHPRPENSLILAIETSCDDTSVAVLERGTRLRAHLIAAQDVHRLYGGVVPELASRAHLELLPPMVERALAEAGVRPAELT